MCLVGVLVKGDVADVVAFVFYSPVLPNELIKARSVRDSFLTFRVSGDDPREFFASTFPDKVERYASLHEIMTLDDLLRWRSVASQTSCFQTEGHPQAVGPARTTPATMITYGYIDATLDDLAFAVTAHGVASVLDPLPEPANNKARPGSEEAQN